MNHPHLPGHQFYKAIHPDRSPELQMAVEVEKSLQEHCNGSHSPNGMEPMIPFWFGWAIREAYLRGRMDESRIESKNERPIRTTSKVLTGYAIEEKLGEYGIFIHAPTMADALILFRRHHQMTSTPKDREAQANLERELEHMRMEENGASPVQIVIKNEAEPDR